MINKHFSPETTGSAGQVKETKSSKKSTVPTKQNDISTVAINVAASWKKNPFFVLLWTTQPVFEKTANDYAVSLKAVVDVQKKQPGTALSLAALDENIDLAINKLKDQIINDTNTRKEAYAKFAELGITKEAKSYVLPRDRDKRKNILPTVLDGVMANNYEKHKYGKAFWTKMITDYNNAYQASLDANKGEGGNVNVKNKQKDTIVAVLKALEGLIDINYPNPKEAEAVKREWGFLKVNY